MRDADPGKEFLECEHFTNCLVGRDRRGRVEGPVGSSDRGEREIEDVGYEEVSSAGATELIFDISDADGDLVGQLLRRATGGVDDIVATALDDVEGIGIGLAAVITEVLRDLMGDAGNEVWASKGTSAVTSAPPKA